MGTHQQDTDVGPDGRPVPGNTVRVVAPDDNAYCDWCYELLTDDDRSQTALGLDAEQSWGCRNCIASNRTCEPPSGWEGDPAEWPKPVFLFDSNDVIAFRSRAKAEAYTEVFDIGDYVFMDAQATVLGAEADGYRVRLSPSGKREPDELRARLRAYLSNERVRLELSLADYPSSAAAVLLGRGKSRRHRS
jgi:hypothetical protein